MEQAALGEAIAQGTQPPFQRRAERIQRLMAHLFGPGGPSIASVSPSALARAPLRTWSKDRRRLNKDGMDALEALLTGRLDLLAGHLSPVVWVHWPDGSILAHEREVLLPALQQRFVKEAPAIPMDGRIYDTAELRSGTAEGVIDALDALFHLQGRGILTARLDGPRLQLDRVTLLLEPHEGRGLLASLPLVALDEAWVASTSAQAEDDEALRVAERAVRHHLLGHGSQLRSLRNQCLRRIFLSDELLEAEEWPPLAAARCDLAQAADTVFLGARRGPTLKEGLGTPRLRGLEQKAKAAWQRPLDHFRPRLVLVKIGRFDPESRAVVEEREIPVVLGREVDRDVRGVETERWRLAALWPSR
jgi:hypothetical protein